MANFEDREKIRKKGVVASMVSSYTESSEKKIAMGRPKETREIKQRISLVVLPSIYEDLKKIAYVDRRSISVIISECMSLYIKENTSKIKEYDKIKNN